MPTDRHTFLFTDLVGFTALTEANGDHHAAELALDFYDRVRRLLPSHEAEEVKTIGDAMMLRGSDPALAVQLGIRIISELEAVPGFPAVRVGMDTGPAVSQHQDWYGATVNVASRLCAAAGGGQVLVSESTRRAAGKLKHVELEEPELHWLKNVTEPVSARLAYDRPCPFSGGPLRSLKLVAGARLAGARS
jgi:class 3 adenylate cyclase